MASITYVSPVSVPEDAPRIPDYAKIVSDTMIELPWYATYGLSYADTMQLPYCDWRRMVLALREKVERDLAKETTSSKELADQNKQLLTILGNVFGRKKKRTP